jgi:hypothetical protein
VKEYVEESKPFFAVGEYWDSCEYSPPGYCLNYNQSKNHIHINILIPGIVQTSEPKYSKMNPLIDNH